MNYLTAYQKRKWKRHELERIYSNLPTTITSSIKDICPDHDVITNANVKLLSQWISVKKYSCVQIVSAFCYSAYQAHIKFNCITECLFEDALKRATLLDNHDEKDSLPLRGIPFSCKDTFDVIGVDTSMGYGNRTFEPAIANSAVVQGFILLGAIVICKTNVPQSLFATECSNNVFGYTVNPSNTKYTPGGSSGGEGALLKCNGAAFGIGSDIAGSIRFPSGYCGIYGLRPSQARSINKGLQILKGDLMIKVVVGPMTRSSDDLQLLFRLMSSQVFFKLDPTTVPLLYKEITAKSLKIGYFIHTDFIQASPASQRGVLMAVNKLQRHGHNVVPILVNNATDMFANAMKIFTADGAHGVTHTKGDLPEKWLYLLFVLIYTPDILIKLFLFILSFLNDKSLGLFLSNFYTKTSVEMEESSALRMQHIHEYVDMMKINKLDAMLCPIASTPAHLTNAFDKTALGNYYSVLYSYLDMPVVAHPMTTVEKVDEWDVPVVNFAEKILKQMYDPSVALPVGIQIAALPYQEEMAIHISKILNTEVELVQR